ncbi:MAG TPA: hypothetical protein VII23_13470 [Terriglobales bacterium]|jgi:hypothetical protein
MAEEQNQGLPRVGIFWLWQGRLILHSVVLSKAESWGRFLNAVGHEGYWRHLQRTGAVPAEVEYDSVPRGRVVYDSGSASYYLYADRCILADQKMVKAILAQLHLPDHPQISPDPHYRCPNCQNLLA